MEVEHPKYTSPGYSVYLMDLTSLILDDNSTLEISDNPERKNLIPLNTALNYLNPLFGLLSIFVQRFKGSKGQNL
jgi:hypothetical protein